MQEETRRSFYENLHQQEKSYSAGEYHMPSLFSISAVRRWFQVPRTASVRALDVGCGKGVFLRDFIRGVQQRWGAISFTATGIDIVRSPEDHFAEISPQFDFRQQNLDGLALPFQDGSFDLVFCNHVLEHIFETERLVAEFRRVIASDGVCVISVPNIAAWINRVTLLFAGQPLGTELGTQSITYGFWPRFLQKKLVRFRPSGHIRDFTPRGLSDLARVCGFETVGWWAQSRGLIARLGKWSGRGIGIVLKPSAQQPNPA